jgi:Na+-translocating ferredoxin:NAD+ oxidoreductase RnfG subunit
MRHAGWSLAPMVALAVPAPAYAALYMTSEQALRNAFPTADAFASSRIALSPAQWQVIDSDNTAPVAEREPRAWIASSAGQPLGHLYVDEVLGKQLNIKYAVVIGLDGRVQRVDILEYRETHGYEVRNARWLAQFAGKDSTSELQLGHDVKNISGATLSCRHVTAGVRRLLAIHEAQQHGR